MQGFGSGWPTEYERAAFPSTSMPQKPHVGADGWAGERRVLDSSGSSVKGRRHYLERRAHEIADGLGGVGFLHYDHDCWPIVAAFDGH